MTSRELLVRYVLCFANLLVCVREGADRRAQSGDFSALETRSAPLKILQASELARLIVEGLDIDVW